MSEYQYYEFQAVDRPLTSADQTELRRFDPSATVGPYRFSLFYEHEEVKFNADRLVDTHFDGFVHLTRSGVRELQLRIPRGSFTSSRCLPYAFGECLFWRSPGKHVVITFHLQRKEPQPLTPGEGWLAALLPLRAELMAGDLRALYVGWLAGVRSGSLEEDDEEPPVPPGLGQPSQALRAFATFLGVDKDLLAVGAQASEPLTTARTPEFEAWLASLPAEEKDALLVRITESPPHLLGPELLRGFRQRPRPPRFAPRTVAQLREVAADHRLGRKRAETRHLVEVRVRALEGLAEREPQVWREVESLFCTRKSMSHARGVQLLLNLKDLAVHRGTVEQFQRRFERLREDNSHRRTLLDRFRAAGLRHGEAAHVEEFAPDEDE
jgi:hypothetical protein